MNYLTVGPRPLLCTREKVAISWSPKAGCTHVLVWYLLQENLLHAANFYHHWPHKYRVNVIDNSEAREARMKLLLNEGPEDWTLIKVTRDPVKRMVASFRHVIKYPLIDKQLQERIHLDVATDGMSMRDFYTALKDRPLTYQSGLNDHVCKQEHPIWRQPFGKIITINMDERDLNVGLNDAAKQTGMRAVNFANVPKIEWLRRNHYAEDVPFEGDDLMDFRFKRGEWVKRFPKSAIQRHSETELFAHYLYGSDFDQVRGNEHIPEGSMVAS